MLFRLYCSEDRQGQLYNLYSALIVHQDKSASTTGFVNKLALIGMRRLSQEVFGLFKRTYIDPCRNFFSEVRDTSIESFLGEALSQLGAQATENDESMQDVASFGYRVSSARSTVKSFVIYQLSNSLPPNGSGVGCGYYDDYGVQDSGGIARLMNEYVFGVCFNPEVKEDNCFHFLDHCLSHLSSSFFSDRDEAGYFASKAELSGGLDPKEMGRYWSRHGTLIRERVEQVGQRYVATLNYRASYQEDLPGVFTVLDELAADVQGVGGDDFPPNRA